MNEFTISIDHIGLANYSGPATLMKRPHRHNEVELNFVEVGAITYLCGGRRERIRCGQLALFWGTIPHQIVEVEGEAMFYWVTIPSATFLQWNLPGALVQRVIGGEFVLEPPVNHEAAVGHAERFRQWRNDFHANSQEYRTIILLEVEACLRRLALSLCNEQHIPEVGPPVKLAPHTLSKVEQMASYIAEYYTSPLRVEDVAEAVHLHPNYAMSLFRKYFGTSITEYVTHYRLAHAQRLLLTTQANVSEIALEAGFGSASRFYSVFKAVCGQLPGEYRKGSLEG